MDQPVISVVIPAYNRESFIVPAVESVLGQGIDAIEVIVVDDCSTDGTVAALEGIYDPRLRIVRHERNKGEAGARNTGVRESKGEYVAYLDSDDQWLPGKLKAQLEYMQAASPEVGGVYTLHYRLYQNGRKSITGYIPDGAPLTFEKLLVKGASISAGSTLMFRRALYDVVGPYDEQARLYVDWDWLLRFLKIARLDLIPEPYAVYEKNPNFRLGAAQKEAAETFLRKYEDVIAALPEKSRKECLSRINLDIARCFAENEGLRQALPYYTKALRMKPFLSAGAWINIVDGVLGTNLLSYIDSVVRGSPARKAS